MKVENNLQVLLSEHISKPAYIIDAENKLLAFNEAGENYVPEISEGSDIFSLIEEEAASQIKEVFQECVKTGTSFNKEIQVKATNLTAKYEISCLPLSTENNGIYLLTIGKIRDDVARDGNKKFLFYTSEIESFVKDSEILKVISSIKSSYPFTFIGKTKFQKDIDNLDVSFWIKDKESKFSVVNKRYASSLGLRVSQIEGQYEKDLLPKFMLKLNKTIDDYILETSNSVVVERENPASMKGQKETIEVIEYPICDIDNNVVAIVGFSRAKLENVIDPNAIQKMFAKIVENLSERCIVYDENEIIRASSNELLKYFNLPDKSYLIEKRVDHVFGLELYDKLKAFKNNTSKNELVIPEFNVRLNERNETLTVSLRKVKESENLLSATFISFSSSEEKQSKDFSDKMYDAIMENSPEAMFIYDIENLRFLEANNAALKLYGYTRDEFLSMDLTDLYAPEDIQTLLGSSGARTMSGDFTGPWRHKKKNGDSILVELSKTSLEYRGRKSHLNLVRDVGTILDKEKELKVLQASFDNSSDMIFNTDSTGFIKYTNQQALSKLGLTKTDLENESFLSFVSDKYRSEISTNVFHAEHRNSMKREVELKSKTGDPVKGLLQATPIFNHEGELDTINLVIKLEEENTIQYITEETPTPVVKIGLDESFLSNVFHELLTPINVIVGFVREITDSIENPTEDQSEAAEIINENQKLLLQLMDNAVEYSSLVQGKSVIRKEEILFTDIIDDLKNNVKKTGEENKVEFAYGKISSSLKFETDRQKLLSLLTLFFKFAIQLTEEQKVYLSAYLFGEDKCIVSVKDDRKSISKKLLNGLKDILNKDEEEVRQKYGFSRFMVKLTQELAKILLVENEALLKSGDAVEFGLVLPVKLVAKTLDEFELESAFDKAQITQSAPLKYDEELILDEPEPISEDPVQIELTPIEDEVEEVIAEKIDSDLDEKVEQLVEEKFEKALGRHQSAHILDDLARTVIEEPEPVRVPMQESTPSKTVVQDASSINVNVSIPHTEPVKAAVEAPVELTPAQVVEEPIPQQRKTIEFSDFSCLYVEDQVDSQILFKVQMKDIRSVDFATSFEKALPLLKSKSFDFIVMDINLQGEYNGLDALRIIQKMPGYQQTPIIAVTAYVLPGDREKFIAAGFVDFISKPILRDKLLDVLKGIF
ncbi:MAG: PAS domain S-box protein [Bacteroidetes bacterium]|nr:PAS domain S-box protein [Bacteroidota bacterium]